MDTDCLVQLPFLRPAQTSFSLNSSTEKWAQDSQSLPQRRAALRKREISMCRIIRNFCGSRSSRLEECIDLPGHTESKQYHERFLHSIISFCRASPIFETVLRLMTITGFSLSFWVFILSRAILITYMNT